ncbi:CHAP domain-containing protein [Acetobacterium malicum]|uniref:CHAP domain-containing protein n=1 Tax=Acetobacterium malicum TaxID=52692 RepID=UPI003593DAF4
MKKDFLKWMSLQLIMLLVVCFATSAVWAEGTEQESTLAADEITASTNPVTCTYQTHIQDVGWQDWKSNGLSSGTSGESKRLEGIRIELDSQGYDLNVAYQTHIQNIGWEADAGRGWKSSGDMSGTEGWSYRLEGIQIKLTGNDADKFDIYYRVHAQNFGWLGWAKNGESAGTAGYGYRLEAIQVKVVSAGSAVPGSTDQPFRDANQTTTPIEDPVVDPPVVEPPIDVTVAVTGVNLNKNVINMAVGENVESLIATVLPNNATNKNITYSSGNQAVVQVDNSGKIQALAAGKCVITVTTADGNKQANCEVNVHQDKVTLADGIYTIKKPGTNGLIDVTGAGTANGTNVTVYQTSNTNNQQWRLENTGNGTIRLWAVCAPDKVLDVLRVSNAIKAFNTIDIWEANDPDCQYWYLTKLYNGAYAIRLNSNDSLAVSNNGRDADVYAGPFDATGSDVMWTFEAVAAPVPEPTPEPTPAPVERAAWIYNTGDVGNVNVRSGPGSQNPSIGGFNEGTQITVIGDLNGDWYQVRGTDRITGGQISGYTHKDYITFSQPSNPGPSFGIRTTAPESGNSHYYSRSNPFYPNISPPNCIGNCTWYAWGRISEIYGRQLPSGYFIHDAYTWWTDNKNGNFYNYGSTPRVGAIAVWGSSYFGAGHVAVVEKIENGKVYVSQSSYNTYLFKYAQLPSPEHLLGYIYVDQPK